MKLTDDTPAAFDNGGLELKAPPWVFSTEHDDSERIAFREAPPPTQIILPAVYRRDGLPPSDGPLPESHEPKPLELRKYSHVALIPNNVVLDARRSQLIAPTFSRRRFNYHGGLVYLRGQKAYESRYSVDLSDPTYSDHPLYYADAEDFAYGHVLLEALTRFWGFSEIDDDMRIATSLPPNRTLRRFMSCFGIDADRILHIDRPVVSRTSYIATIPVARRKWIHPAAWEVFDRLKRLSTDSDIVTAEKIFLSRSRIPLRTLVNERRVEAYFKSKGFLVVHPQDLRIEDQIRLITSAKLIAGVGGSGMHNVLFAEDAKVLILCSEGWLVNVDTLLSQVRGRLGYVFGRPLEPTERGRRTVGPWRIDLADVREAVRLHFDLPHDGAVHPMKVMAKRLQGRLGEVPNRPAPAD